MTESASPAPKVSVIIPLYNKAPYIKRALDSVLAQTVQDFEIVVVGGNSSDGGEDIVKGYTDSRIRFIQEAGKGVSAARNQGVDEAKAELVAFLDADDEWLPEFLETILRLREMWSEAGLYTTGARQIDENGNLFDRVYNPEIDEQLLENYFRVKNKIGFDICLCSWLMVPKKIFIEIGGFPLDCIQSEDLHLRAKIAFYYPIAYSSKICAVYYRDDATYIARAKNGIDNPFNNPQYWNEQEIMNHKYSSDIIEFIDHERLFIAGYNIFYSKKRRDIRNDLRKIKTLSLKKSKEYYIYQLLSYIPSSMALFIKKCWNRVHHS